jgi:hypothetical protein
MPDLSNKVYDKIKFAVQLLLPAISTLYFTLGTIWSWPSIEQVVGSIAAVTVFLGAFLKTSSVVYNASDSKYDGVVIIDDSNPEKDVVSLETFGDPVDVIPGKKEILLKVMPPENS